MLGCALKLSDLLKVTKLPFSDVSIFGERVKALLIACNLLILNLVFEVPKKTNENITWK